MRISVSSLKNSYVHIRINQSAMLYWNVISLLIWFTHKIKHTVQIRKKDEVDLFQIFNKHLGTLKKICYRNWFGIKEKTWPPKFFYRLKVILKEIVKFSRGRMLNPKFSNKKNIVWMVYVWKNISKQTDLMYFWSLCQAL